MTAEKLRLSQASAVYLKVLPIYTTIQGIKVLLCAEKLGHSDFRLQLCLQSTLVWTPEISGTVAYFPRLPADGGERHSLKCLTDAQ
jgi:hypothetical protein